MLSRYKQWVKRHPNFVQKLDYLDLLSWIPNRTNRGYELAYEAYHAGIGLFSLVNQIILEEGELPTSRPSPYYWLDAIENVETLVELRGIQLESAGKMSRYGPLLVVEIIKSVLKMAAWSRYSGHMFLRRPSPDDLHQFESELGLQDILAALDRLLFKYTAAAEEETAYDASSCASAPPPTAAATASSPTTCSVTAAAVVAVEVEVEGKDAVSSEIVAVEVTGMEEAVCKAACTASTAAAGWRTSRSYGVRGYVAQQLGWVRGLVTGVESARGGCAADAGCSSAGAQACRTSGGQEAEGRETSAASCRALSGAACSTSPRCSLSGGGSNVRRGPWVAGDPWVWPDARQRMREQLGSRNVTAAPADGGMPEDTLPSAEAGCVEGGRGSSCGGGSSSSISAARGRWVRRKREEQQPYGQDDVAGPAGTEAEDPDMHMGRNLLWLAELLYIWRPVVYVSLLKRYGRRSWRPWLASLAVDLLSGHFRRRGHKHMEAAAARLTAWAAAAEAGLEGLKGPAAATTVAGARAKSAYPWAQAPKGAGSSLLGLALARALAAPGATAGEEQEVYDRRRRLLLYALRSPFLETVTMPVLSAIRKATRRVPLVGYGVDYLYDLTDTFTSYYSYTSGSN